MSGGFVNSALIKQTNTVYPLSRYYGTSPLVSAQWSLDLFTDLSHCSYCDQYLQIWWLHL